MELPSWLRSSEVAISSLYTRLNASVCVTEAFAHLATGCFRDLCGWASAARP